MDVTPYLEFELKPIDPKTIVMNPHVLDWCHLPYYNAPDGCKMWQVCPYCPHNTTFDPDLPKRFRKYTLVLAKFDFVAYRAAVHEQHPDWVEGKCGNLRMWQGSVKSKMWHYIEKQFGRGAVVYGGRSNQKGASPEAVGVDLYSTFRRNGIPFDHTSSKKTGNRYINHATFCALVCENSHQKQGTLF